jgi:hypothetical protein
MTRRAPSLWSAFVAVPTMALVVGLALSLTACAITRNTESLLAQAGFRQVPADTPKKLAHLKTLPQRQLVARTHEGQKYYVFADAEGCKCMYVGRDQQYQSYRALARDQRVAEDQAVALEDAREWEIESCCGR